MIKVGPKFWPSLTVALIFLWHQSFFFEVSRKQQRQAVKALDDEMFLSIIFSRHDKFRLLN